MVPGIELGDSANKPVVLTCVETVTGTRADYVVKLMDGERMTSADSHMRETIAAFMAMEMEVPTALPAVVSIGPQLVQSSAGQWVHGRLARSVGHNFGSGLLSESPEFTAAMDLNAYQKQDAALVLSFDVLLKHFDRRAAKPNLLSDGTRLYVIDHELAFGFVFDLFPSATPWVLTEADIKLLPNHLLYTKVKGLAFDVDDHVERLERLDDAFWDKVWEELPPAWRHDQYQRIRTHLAAVRGNARAFYEQLSHHLP